MGYAARAGFGAGFWQTVQTQTAKMVAAKTAPAPTAPAITATPVPQPPSTQPLAQPIQPIPTILVAGPAPSPGGGGGGGGGEFGLAPAPGGGLNVSALLQQPAVLVGIAILGFLALRRGGGTRRW